MTPSSAPSAAANNRDAIEAHWSTTGVTCPGTGRAGGHVATAPPTDLPAAADPCVALTPSVVNQLRTSGALTPLVSDEVPTSTLIVAGRALTGCPPTNDPDPATVR